MEEIKEFAESVEGQNMIILHDLGYKLADSQQELTPEQSLFLIHGVNYRTKKQNEEINNQTNVSGNRKIKHNSDELRKRTKQRQKERGEVDNG